MEEEIEDDASKKPVRKIYIVFGIIFICFCFIAGSALGLGLFVSKALQPAEFTDESVRLTIQSGMHSGSIARLLEEEGLIRNHLVFRYYLTFNNEGSRFQAGTYDIQPGTPLDEIIAKLNEGRTIEREMIRFTIPEGWNVEQIAERLAEQHGMNKDVILKLANDPESLQSPWLSQVPDTEDLIYRLEGYLFPETYELVKDSDELAIVNRMLAELDRKLEQLPEDWTSQLEQLGLTFHEMMTIASMIEREVVVDDEKSIVSGIIYNRLEAGMKLQLDATVQYLFPEQKEIVTYDDLKIHSPYNTYEVYGLPPGPIASPGIKSIYAALYPEETTYLFYVTKKDGSQRHLFAETYNEHLNNIELSKQGSQ